MAREKALRTAFVVAAVGLLLVAAVPASAAKETPIFKVTDPRGDDYGDGSLIYPQRTDLQRGDLDLLSFSAFADKGGTIFEIAFARPVRKPGREVIDNLGGTLESIARLGFYAFNVDIYIDTDRVSGSGERATFPGRRAEVAEADAWERAICLTPRPYEAQQLLRRLLIADAKRQMKDEKGRLESGDEEEAQHRVDAGFMSKVVFPTLVWEQGLRIRCFVPATFLGGTAKASWGYVVAVSFADIEERFNAFPSDRPVFSLMIVPVQSGRGPRWVGGGNEDDPLQPPLIDIIVPPGKSQEQVLKDYDPRYILTKNRPVQLPAVVPQELATK